MTARQWQAVFRQMMGHDLVRPDPERHGALRMTEAARPILRGEAGITLRREAIRTPDRRPAARALVSEEDAPLLSALKAKRRALAEAAKVPAYVIFPDRTLIEMAETRPASLDAMARINGVGAKKLERYGTLFLEVITGRGRAAAPGAAQAGRARGRIALRPAAGGAGRRWRAATQGTDKPLSCSAAQLARVAQLRPRDSQAMERLLGANARRALRGRVSGRSTPRGLGRLQDITGDGMLVVISPAKRLDWTERDRRRDRTAFAADAARLARTARNLTLKDLKGLMDLSSDLARLNRDRFRAFADAPEAEATRPAALAFAGDTYLGLEAASLDAEELDWAQEHLRILSGLYGLLRPRDAIQPYRLEMGSRLKTRRGASLYDYWGDRLAGALNAQGAALGTEVLVNCASQEYFGAVPRRALKLRVVTPVFMEETGGAPRIVSFHAKRARGAMARFIVQNRLTDPAALTGFDSGGYGYRADLSEPGRPVFTRAAQP